MASLPSRSTLSVRGPAPYALRRGAEVARIHLDDVCVVTRTGNHCKIIEYPNVAAAARAHARAIARLVEHGFVEEAL